MSAGIVRYRIVITVDYAATDSDGNSPDPADIERDIEQALPGRIYSFEAYPVMEAFEAYPVMETDNRGQA